MHVHIDIVMHKCKFVQIVMKVYVELMFRVPINFFNRLHSLSLSVIIHPAMPPEKKPKNKEKKEDFTCDSAKVNFTLHVMGLSYTTRKIALVHVINWRFHKRLLKKLMSLDDTKKQQKVSVQDKNHLTKLRVGLTIVIQWY